MEHYNRFVAHYEQCKPKFEHIQNFNYNQPCRKPVYDIWLMTHKCCTGDNPYFWDKVCIGEILAIYVPDGVDEIEWRTKIYTDTKTTILGRWTRDKMYIPLEKLLEQSHTIPPKLDCVDIVNNVVSWNQPTHLTYGGKSYTRVELAKPYIPRIFNDYTNSYLVTERETEVLIEHINILDNDEMEIWKDHEVSENNTVTLGLNYSKYSHVSLQVDSRNPNITLHNY